jgi:hypothetical protein
VIIRGAQQAGRDMFEHIEVALSQMQPHSVYLVVHIRHILLKRSNLALLLKDGALVGFIAKKKRLCIENYRR